jgi:hypothetical protein
MSVKGRYILTTDALSFVHQLKIIWSPCDSKTCCKGHFRGPHDFPLSGMGDRQRKCAELSLCITGPTKGLAELKISDRNRSEYLSKPWMNLETSLFVTKLVLSAIDDRTDDRRPTLRVRHSQEPVKSPQKEDSNQPLGWRA